MPSDDNGKGVAFPQNGKGEKKDRKKHGKSIGWIIGVVVLILISLTFVLPTTIFSSGNSSSIEFGRYNGEKIELAYGNYFYNQLSAIMASGSVNNQNVMQAYQQAYYLTVLETALRQMGKQAGISVTDKMVDNAIVESGYFNDENGNYSSDLYREASAMEKSMLRMQLEETVPAQMAMNDITSVKTSAGEAEFVSAFNDNVKAFEYITVDYNAYPDADATAYAEANGAPFTAMDLSIITLPSEDAAASLLEAIQNGERTFEDAAAADSSDQWRTANGAMGQMLYFEIQNMLMDPVGADTLFASAQGDITGPLQGWTGYILFRADSAASSPDYSDGAVLSKVKSYISANDAETMDAYLSAKADEVYAAASTDFAGAAESAGLEITEVGPSSANPASSQFIIGPEYSDSKSLLASAAAMDQDYYSELFTAEDNTVLAPQKSGNAYVIARPVVPEGNNELLSSYMDTFYSTYMPEITAQDLQAGIMNSDAFTDNFLQVFFDRILGPSLSAE